MYLKILKKLSIPLATAGSILSVAQFDKEKLKTVYTSWTTEYKSSTEWDTNWDHRSPTYLLQHHDASLIQEKEKNEKVQKYKPSAIRHIILVRHGQYNLEGETDSERTLTELGKEQARATGMRIREQFPINEFIISTMTRAQETGKIMLTQLNDDQRKIIEIRDEPLIEEGSPIPPEPRVGHWRPQPSQFFIDGARIEAGFREHFHRANCSQKEDSYTLMVCHANVIRYFICRALQLPAEAWLRISLHHASITWISIYPSGRVILRMLGDCGHMPKKMMSTK